MFVASRFRGPQIRVERTDSGIAPHVTWRPDEDVKTMSGPSWDWAADARPTLEVG
jgi:hypothetical protein